MGRFKTHEERQAKLMKRKAAKRAMRPAKTPYTVDQDPALKPFNTVVTTEDKK